MPLTPFDKPTPIQWNPGRRRRRWLLVLLALVFIGAGMMVWMVFAGRSSLQAAVAEANRLDPGWQMDDIIAARAEVPDDRNSALHIMRAKGLIDQAVRDPLVEQAAEEKLELFAEYPAALANVEQQAALFDLLKPYRPALAEFRKLAAMPDGRFPLKLSPDFIGTILNSQDSRVGMNILRYDLRERLEHNDIEGAVTALHAIINSARSVGDEPFLISFLIRVAGEAITVVSVERFLAQTLADEATLATLQKLLENEARLPLFTVALRGERAGSFACIDYLKSQPKSFSALGALTGGPTGGTPWEMMLAYLPGWMGTQQADVLRLTTEAVEISKRPVEEQHDAFAAFEKKVPTMSILARLLCPALSKVASANARLHADLRCAIVALAAERYRREHGQWPERLDDLVAAKLIASVPLDPFDGKPLRWQTKPEGRLLYSIGPDRIDDGGNCDVTKKGQKGYDMGFRLYDADKRRQAPRPPKVVDG